jgi:hypothetical protein
MMLNLFQPHAALLAVTKAMVSSAFTGKTIESQSKNKVAASAESHAGERVGGTGGGGGKGIATTGSGTGAVINR